MTPPAVPDGPSLGELSRAFARIGVLSFGGPAGQIGLMHRVVVDEKRWMHEPQFLHALNFCMLLPGPEAMQLATYVGWLTHGTRGALITGSLFVLPGLGVIIALSALYTFFGAVPVVAGLLFGLKAAVLAVILQALIRIAGRALGGKVAWTTAIAAFAAIAFLKVPFPIIIVAAALAGAALNGPATSADRGGDVPPWTPRAGSTALTATIWLCIWLAPVVALFVLAGGGHVLTQIAAFFSQTALVTFGGAYAVLAFVAQRAVESYHWLGPEEMLTGLGLAETTPGPLILVLNFVAFVAGARLADLGSPLLGGVAGALVAAWVTYAPCFLFILAGAPHVERLRRNRFLSAALSSVTAAVVGVIANLALWFGLHTLFGSVGEWAVGPLAVPVVSVESVDWRAAVVLVVAGMLLFALKWGLVVVLSVSAAGGVLLRLLS